jgi:hypothetical protein
MGKEHRIIFVRNHDSGVHQDIRLSFKPRDHILAYVLFVSEIEPASATQILARARMFGASLVVCGVQDVDAVKAGRIAGSAVVARPHVNRSFAFTKYLNPPEYLLPRSDFPDPQCCGLLLRLTKCPRALPGQH